CTGDVVGQIAGMSGLAVDVVATLEDQGGHPNGRQDRAHIDLGVHPEVGQGIAGAKRKSLVAAPPLTEWLVREPRWRYLGEEDPGPPRLVGKPVVVGHPAGPP